MPKIRQFIKFFYKILLTRKYLLDFAFWMKAFWAITRKNNFPDGGVGTSY